MRGREEVLCNTLECLYNQNSEASISTVDQLKKKLIFKDFFFFAELLCDFVTLIKMLAIYTLLVNYRAVNNSDLISVVIMDKIEGDLKGREVLYVP